VVGCNSRGGVVNHDEIAVWTSGQGNGGRAGSVYGCFCVAVIIQSPAQHVDGPELLVLKTNLI
jgi:hypothetical protein